MSSPIRTTVALCALLLLGSCRLLIKIPDDSGITYCPVNENQVLGAQEIPHICFDFEVNRASVEALFSIQDAVGEIAGVHEWDNRTVCYRSHSELIPGRRYVFSFAGTYRDLEGIEYLTHRIVPFYYKERDETAPYVVSSSPASGQILGSSDSISVLFSEAIDPSSLNRGLSITPDTPFSVSWENGTTELVLTPQSEWNHCACYEITFSEELYDEAGVPLAEMRELVFWVQGDIESPRILSVEPGLNRPAELYPWAGYGIGELLGLRDVLRIHFTEAMDTGSTTDAMSLHPSLSNQCIWIDSACLVVVPTGGFQADNEYLLSFGAQATDVTGNAISMSEPIRFATIPGEITVVTEFVQDGIQLDHGDYSTATAVEIHPYPISSAADYELLFRFEGSRFASNTEKYTVQEAINLFCIFPDSGVPNPIATGFSWMGDLVLSVTFSELQPSTANQKVYYLLRIRGGTNGIVTDEGCRLQQDIEQLLLTAVE